MKRIFIAISLLCFLLEITAQEINDSSINYFLGLSIKELLNIKVTTTNKKEEKLIESPAVVNVITTEEIQMLNFNTLEEVLEYSVGLASINGEASLYTTTTVRGNTLVNYNTNTLLLFDGIPIYNAYHGSFDLQTIPLGSIERIEIVKGSNSVLYGTNAINAVINIISKKARADKKSYIASSGRIKYGSFNTLYTNAAIFTKHNDFKASFFADVNTTKGETLIFNDEQGDTLDMQKRYKGASMVSKIEYKDVKLHLQYSNREHPTIMTRDFSKAYSGPDDTLGISVTDFIDEYVFVCNVDYNHNFSEKLGLHFRSSFLDWNNKKIKFDSYLNYSSFGIYNDLEITINPLERSSNILGISYNNYFGKRYNSKTGEYDIGKDNKRTNDYAIFLNGSFMMSETFQFFYG